METVFDWVSLAIFAGLIACSFSGQRAITVRRTRRSITISVRAAVARSATTSAITDRICSQVLYLRQQSCSSSFV